MRGLTYEVAIDLLDIEPTCRDHINDAELKDFSTSMIDIGRRASAIYKDLCTKEASIASANLELLYARKAPHEGKDYRKQRAIGIAKCNHVT